MDLEKIRKENTKFFEDLKNAYESNIISPDEVQKKITLKREKIIKKHAENHSIWQGCTNHRWYTYLPDGSPKGRKVAKTNLEDLHEAIVNFYREQGGITVQKLYKEWIEYKTASTRSSAYIARIKADWRTYYQDTEFAQKDISKITIVDFELWANELIKKYSMTKKQYYNVTVIVRQGFIYAKKKGYVKENLFAEAEVNTRLFKPEQKADSKLQVYTEEEQKRMKQEMWRLYNEKPQYTAPLAIIFMFYTGLRIGELVALKASDIEGNQIHVQRQEVRVFESLDTEHSRMAGYKVVDHTKTDVGNRYVPLVPAAQELLNKVRQVNQNFKWYDEDYLFLSNGKRIKHGAIEGRIIDACNRLGMPVKTAHKFRKTYISTLYDARVPLEAIRKIVGHADERTTLHNYCFNRYTDEQTFNMIENALQKESVTPCNTKVVSFSACKKREKPAQNQASHA